jgi:hypothetical protein
MKVFKFKDSGNECFWTRAEEMAILEVVSDRDMFIRVLGTGDDLAYDVVRVTTVPGRSGEVASHIAGLIHNGKPMLIDVNALTYVLGCSRLIPDG